MDLLFFALQAVSGPALDDPRLHAAPKCAPAHDDEVRVCARPNEPYRLRPLPERYTESALPKAETTILGDVKVSGEVEQAGVGGAPSNRAMVRFKVPF